MIPVTKYHGCGNDFIITDWELLKHKNIEDFVKHVCDRHTGIGADGCILVKQKPLEMVFYNADGSRAPMCGTEFAALRNTVMMRELKPQRNMMWKHWRGSSM